MANYKITPKTVIGVTSVIIELSNDDATHLSYALHLSVEKAKKWVWWLLHWSWGVNIPDCSQLRYCCAQSDCGI